MDKDGEDFHYLAAPARRALGHAGIRTLADLGRLTQAELAGLHGMGPNAMRCLSERMAAQNIGFATRKD